MRRNTSIRKEKYRHPARQASSPATRHRQNPRPRPGTPVPRRSLRSILIVAVCALLVGAGTWALFEFVIWNTTPAALVGKWVVMEGPDEGGTVDFHRNGTMVAKVNQGGFEGIINAVIRVEGK